MSSYTNLRLGQHVFDNNERFSNSSGQRFPVSTSGYNLPGMAVISLLNNYSVFCKVVYFAFEYWCRNLKLEKLNLLKLKWKLKVAQRELSSRLRVEMG